MVSSTVSHERGVLVGGIQLRWEAYLLSSNSHLFSPNYNAALLLVLYFAMSSMYHLPSGCGLTCFWMLLSMPIVFEMKCECSVLFIDRSLSLVDLVFRYEDQLSLKCSSDDSYLTYNNVIIWQVSRLIHLSLICFCVLHWEYRLKMVVPKSMWNLSWALA